MADLSLCAAFAWMGRVVLITSVYFVGSNAGFGNLCHFADVLFACLAYWMVSWFDKDIVLVSNELE
jgi:hypothetical protein